MNYKYVIEHFVNLTTITFRKVAGTKPSKCIVRFTKPAVGSYKVHFIKYSLAVNVQKFTK